MKKRKIISFILVLTLMISIVPTINAKTAVKISKKTQTIKVNKSSTIKIKGGKADSWITSNPKVVAITKTTQTSVKVKAISKGKATITAKVGKKSLKCKMTVTGEDTKTKQIASLKKQIKDLQGEIEKLKKGDVDKEKKMVKVFENNEIVISYSGYSHDEENYDNIVFFTLENKTKHPIQFSFSTIAINSKSYNISYYGDFLQNTSIEVPLNLWEITKETLDINSVGALGDYHHLDDDSDWINYSFFDVKVD